MILFVNLSYLVNLYFIFLGDVRNDIYVTISAGDFKKGGKTSDKNVQVCMTVCKENGDVLKVCVGSFSYEMNQNI